MHATSNCERTSDKKFLQSFQLLSVLQVHQQSRSMSSQLGEHCSSNCGLPGLCRVYKRRIRTSQSSEPRELYSVDHSGVYNKDKTGYCSTFTNINAVSDALKRVKDKGLFRLSEERYSSGNDGFKLLCTDYHGSVSISSYDQLFDATFTDIAQVLMGGRPVIATLLCKRLS